MNVSCPAPGHRDSAKISLQVREMERLFDKTSAEALVGPELKSAREYLCDGLREFTGIPFEECSEAETIHCTDIQTRDPHSSPFALTWRGFIASSDYRDDGVLVFGAHLFPLIGGKRACLLRPDAGLQNYDDAFRYIMLTKETGWEDRGWHKDVYEEFEHWYCDENA